MRCVLNIILFLLTFSLSAQKKEQKRTMDSLYLYSIVNNLEKQYGYNKEIPERYKTAIFCTLSYFPELDSKKIVFKEKKIKTTLNARPSFLSVLFRTKNNRKYIII